ncbi:MAG TPA: hypothetical protein VMX14_13420 [Anaerolineae bacterium]|nr:hypothetical protein [Anaerolineae bacterium]
MLFLREDTVVTVMIGPFLDSTDGVTAEIALTIDQGDVHLSKNGGAFENKNEATACTHDAEHNGWYTCPLDATDTNTAGVLILAVNEAGALPVWVEFMIMPQQVWDSLFSTDKLQVHAAEITDGLITAAAIADAAIDIATFAADVGTTAVAANAIAKAVGLSLVAYNLDHLCFQATATADMTTELADNTILSRIIASGHTSNFVPSTDALHALMTDVDAILEDTGTTLDGIVDSILLDTAVIGALGAGLTAIPWNATWDAEIQSEVNDALVALNLDHLCAVATAAADMTTELVDNSILSRALGAGDTSTFVPSTDSLHAAGVDLDAVLLDTGTTLDDLLDAITAAKIADAVWDEVLTGHIVAGTTGYALTQAAVEAPAVGAIAFTYTLTDSATGLPIADCLVWACTDSAGANKVTSAYTDDSGQVVLYLDAGTYYLFRKKSGYSFTNPDTETVA